MGHGFGGLVRNARGQVQFGLSPFRQRAVGSFFTTGLVSWFKYALSYMPIMAPGLVTSALVYKYGKDTYEANQRKNVAEFTEEK